MSEDFDDGTPEKPATVGELGYAIRDIYRRLKGGNAKFALMTRALFVVGTVALGSLGSAIGMAYKAGSFVEAAGQAQQSLAEQGRELRGLAATVRDQREEVRLLQQKQTLADSLLRLEQLVKSDPLGRRKRR